MKNKLERFLRWLLLDNCPYRKECKGYEEYCNNGEWSHCDRYERIWREKILGE